jgi:drug/metabolite transporter (DMT)-like permease
MHVPSAVPPASRVLPRPAPPPGVAVAPLIAVPFAFWLQGHKPPRFWYLGATLAIAGLALLYLNS